STPDHDRVPALDAHLLEVGVGHLPREDPDARRRLLRTTLRAERAAFAAPHGVEGVGPLHGRLTLASSLSCRRRPNSCTRGSPPTCACRPSRRGTPSPSTAR